MSEATLYIAAAIYLVWIAGIVIALYLMLTNRAAARPMTTIVVFGSDGIALLVGLFLIARAAGAL